MNKLVVFGFIGLMGLTTLNAKADNLSDYYQEVKFTDAQKKFIKLEYLKPGEQVEIFKDDDSMFKKLLSENYVPIGQSSFLDKDLPTKVFENKARSLGASAVVLYKKTASSNSYIPGENPNNLYFIYDYVATFYVKNSKYKENNMLGIGMEEIPLDKRNLYQRNTGAYTYNVYKGGRAYKANILPEDVIIKINDIDVLFPEEMNKIKDNELKKTNVLNFTILRLVNNELREIKIPVDFTNSIQ